MRCNSLVEIATIAPVVAPENEHATPVDDCRVAVPRTGRSPIQAQHRHPLHRAEVELEEVVHAVAAVEPGQDVERVGVNDARVTIPWRRRRPRSPHVRPSPRRNIELEEVVHAIRAIVTCERVVFRKQNTKIRLTECKIQATRLQDSILFCHLNNCTREE